MSFYKRTIEDIDLQDKRVLVRVDYNVPLENGKITDDYRIKKSIDTIKFLIEKNCKIILCSHLGRPEGRPHSEMSLKPVASRLGELLGIDIQFSNDCIGDEAKTKSNNLENGQVLLLENLRFYDQEEKNDDQFAKDLSELADIFVQDAFGVVHRAHASTEAITNHLPSVAGLLLEREVTVINQVMENPSRPLMAIIGGAKISDKIDILNRFVEIADVVIVGGAMANTFLMAKGINVGNSLVEDEEIATAKEIIEKANIRNKESNFIFYLPQDGVVAKKIDKKTSTRIVDWDAHIVADIENYPKKVPKNTSIVEKDEMILDIGPFSGAFISGTIQLVNTVVWNGAMGVTEVPSINGPVGPFAHGTEQVVNSLLGEYGHKPFTVIGGGDTVGFIEQKGLVDNFDHVSTGGGASMELMSGKKLPGVEALLDS